MTELSEEEFRRLLDAKGLKLDAEAFAPALKGGRHLKSEIALLVDYLKRQPDKHDD